MAIIIQDIDMPAQCWQCPFSFRIDNAHTVCLRNPMEKPVEDGNERPKHCPLKEVKQHFKRGEKMPDREKTIRGLEWILEDDRFGFGQGLTKPESDEEQAGCFIREALTLLKEQDGLAKAVDQEHRVNEYLNKQLADRPEIVRCKDCKRHYTNGGACDQVLTDWFCADGKRRTDDA